MLSKAPHVTIGLPVMEGHSGEVVEGGIQVMGDHGWRGGMRGGGG